MGELLARKESTVVNYLMMKKLSQAPAITVCCPKGYCCLGIVSGNWD